MRFLNDARAEKQLFVHVQATYRQIYAPVPFGLVSRITRTVKSAYKVYG